MTLVTMKHIATIRWFGKAKLGKEMGGKLISLQLPMSHIIVESYCWMNISAQHNKYRTRNTNWVGLIIHNRVLSWTLIFTPRLRFPPGSLLTRDCAKILKHSRVKRNTVAVWHTSYPLFMTFLTDSDVFVSALLTQSFLRNDGISECFWTILSNSSKQKSISSNRNLTLR